MELNTLILTYLKLSIENTLFSEVQNAYGLWSEWASKTVTVRKIIIYLAKINVSHMEQQELNLFYFCKH